MRKSAPEKLEQGRIGSGNYGSDPGAMWGAFHIQGPCGARLTIISSGVDEEFRWEHVSVSTERRTPNWAEMSFVKDLFWDEEECVVQFHPPKSSYVNYHPHCLHLWKPVDAEIKMPGTILVGPITDAPRSDTAAAASASSPGTVLPR
jgi:hypothetical protein